MGERCERRSELIKEVKEDNVPLSSVLIFVNWRFYICQVMKIIIEMTLKIHME